MAFLFRAISKLFWIYLAGVALCLTAAILAPFFADRSLLAEIAVHFQLQYVILLVIVTLVFALGRHWKCAGYCLVVTAAAFCYHLLPLYLRAEPRSDAPRSLRLVSSNVAYFNNERDKLIEFIQQEKPDVIVLVEVSPPWLENLAKLDADYPYKDVRPSPGHSGLAIYSHFPLEDISYDATGLAIGIHIVKSVLVGEKNLTVVAVHPEAPTTNSAISQRNAEFQGLAKLAVALPKPLLLAGDFNTSGWSMHFKKLIADSGLRDSRRGFGVQPTWQPIWIRPSIGWIYRTPIDHCLVSPQLNVLDRRVGPDVGSDHRPIIVDLLIK